MKAKEAEPERWEGSGRERLAGGRGAGCVNLLLQTLSLALFSRMSCPGAAAAVLAAASSGPPSPGRPPSPHL